MKDAAVPYPRASSPSDPQVLALFQDELARIVAVPGLAAAGPDVLPRFAGCYQRLARLPRRLRRQLQRRWRRSLAAIALLLALGQAPALAATINVDGTSCTLVDAITAANTDAATGGCTAGSGADTLVLAAGSTHTLIEVNDGTDGPTGLPAIASVITIEGNGSTIRRDRSVTEFRILAVRSNGNLTLQETTVSGGSWCPTPTVVGSTTAAPCPLVDSTVSGNSAGLLGAACTTTVPPRPY